MIVTAICKERINSVSLPDKIRGQYWLFTFQEAEQKQFVSVEGINNKWVLKSNNEYFVLDRKGNRVKEQFLSENSVYVVENNKKQRSFVFCEPIADHQITFKKYVFRDNLSLVVGREKSCDICVNSPVVSQKHTKLEFFDDKWTITDLDSSNGTFVNSKRINFSELNFGDVVYIMGLKIIVAKNFIAINSIYDDIELTDALVSFIPQVIDEDEDDFEDAGNSEINYFYRSPRFKREVEDVDIKIDSPPSSPIADEMPIALVVGTSMGMGLMSMVTLANAIITNNPISMLMGATMLLGTLLIPTITKFYDRSRKRKKEQLRQKKYREYLESMEAKISDECVNQTQIINENVVTVAECEERVIETKRNLWERDPSHNDFISLRIGKGDLDARLEIEYSKPGFKLEEDSLDEELNYIGSKKPKLNNVPVSFSLFENNITGIFGSHEELMHFLNGLIIQLAAYYSYDLVKFALIYDDNEWSELNLYKWLPHVWTNDYRFRFLARNLSELKELDAALGNIILSNDDADKDSYDNQYFILFSLSKKLATQSDAVKNLLKSKNNIGVSLVCLYDSINELPSECKSVIELNKQESMLYDLSNISGVPFNFNPDLALTYSLKSLCKKLANTFIDTSQSGSSLPEMISFMQLFNVARVEHLNPLTRWKENNPTKTLQAAVGINTQGELFYLDLHEKFHGPHGLVAGMTGSGKSEFIITYILSLAINYHPNEVAFILIDYKGGGMAKTFENLPHTVGVITNLDGAAINRSLVSIESELKRRQAIFASASKKVHVSNIDIYKYQKLYREGKVDEPLQHLFIISDEFAELKTQQPEFMVQLISTARIGRSLGVHLILATQKPSGVVDDQIWSNSRFRVCLKVQSKADSVDMLKKPDAAKLVETGRFYLQVGYDELYELGQSAWSGAPYYPSDKVVKTEPETVSVIDINGQIVSSSSYDKNALKFSNPNKQVDEITKYLQEIAINEGIKVKPLWLEPLPGTIVFNEIKEKYKQETSKFKLQPLIGEYDDPSQQKQGPYYLPLSEDGNTVIYGSAGMGKTSFLNAMIFSLITTYSPDEVNLYLIDFASETLRAFSKAPHVGDIMFSADEEKINNLFKMLIKESKDRKKLFSDFGGDYQSYIANSNETRPSIVVVINNFAAFTDTYEELENTVNLLTREGAKYGIYFVLTATGVNVVKFRLLQNFKQLIALQLNDPSDYASVVGRTGGLLPSKYKGRGLYKSDKLYEFQTASLCKEDLPFMYITGECLKLNKEWTGVRAAKVPVLPENVDVEFVRDDVRPGSLHIPVGVDKNSLKIKCFPFSNSAISVILSKGDSYQSLFLALIDLVSDTKLVDYITLDENFVEKEDTSCDDNQSSSIESKIDDLFNEVVMRNNTYKANIEKGKKTEPFDPLLVFINSYNNVKNNVGPDGKEKLRLVLEKNQIEYNVFFILGDRDSEASTYMYEAWYKDNIDGCNGVWVGDAFSEQYLIKPASTNPQMRKKISSDSGYVVVDGSSIFVKILGGNSLEDDNE